MTIIDMVCREKTLGARKPPIGVQEEDLGRGRTVVMPSESQVAFRGAARM